MFGRFSSSLGLVGVDFGSHGVKLLQLREQGDNLQVVGAARVDATLWRAPPPPALSAKPGQKPALAPDEPTSDSGVAAGVAIADRLADRIRDAYAGGRFIGRKCVISLARSDVCLQSIRLPRMPDDELRQSAAWEASQRFGFDRNAMQVDFIRTGATMQSGENREEVILVAASHAAIHARLEPLLAAGLRPMAVDTAFAAMVRTFSRQVRREADLNIVRAVVEIGSSGSTVMILRGDQIAFCKPFGISGADFNKAVAEHLQMDEQSAADLRSARIAALTAPAEASDPRADTSTDRAVYEAVRPLMGELIKEVTLCLRYYGVTFRGHPPEKIVLTGGDGQEPHLGEMMAKACKTPVVFDDVAGTLGDLIGQVRESMNRDPGPAASWAVAAGLSLRGIGKARRLSKPLVGPQAVPASREAA